MSESTKTVLASGTVKYRNARGQFHRTDGPAIAYANGDREFWIHGEELTEYEFNTRAQFATTEGAEGAPMLDVEGFRSHAQPIPDGGVRAEDALIAAHPGLLTWFMAGGWEPESCVVVRHGAGIPNGGPMTIPTRWATFRRCELLLRQVTTLRDSAMASLPAVSPGWAALVEAWPSLVHLAGEGYDWASPGEPPRAAEAAFYAVIGGVS